jgi:hypothetical protein
MKMAAYKLIKLAVARLVECHKSSPAYPLALILQRNIAVKNGDLYVSPSSDLL